MLSLAPDETSIAKTAWRAYQRPYGDSPVFHHDREPWFSPLERQFVGAGAQWRARPPRDDDNHGIVKVEGFVKRVGVRHVPCAPVPTEKLGHSSPESPSGDYRDCHRFCSPT
jgi:hypothetical protein